MGSVRWACCSTTWNPKCAPSTHTSVLHPSSSDTQAFHCDSSAQEWQDALSLLSTAERERVGRFLFEKDRKLALVGQLLIRRYLWHVQEITNIDAMLRTCGRKPILPPRHTGKYPNGTFNISHHGDWVVLAAEPTALVGVDVMRVELPGNAKSAEALFHDLRDTLTDGEWRHVREPGTEEAQLRRFYRLWTLKESYVKAIGVGIAHDLKRLHFAVARDDSHAALALDGRGTEHEWRFELSWLDPLHPVAVALGPAAAADAEQQASIASVSEASTAWKLYCSTHQPTSPATAAAPFQVVSVPWLCS